MFQDVDWMSSGKKLALAADDSARFLSYLEKDVAVSKFILNNNWSLF
jgi:hypothetical protein